MKIIIKFSEVNKIAEKIAKIKNVKAVYLFGSYATGRQYELSDTDLCIIGNLKEKEELEVLRFGSEKIDVSVFDKLPLYIKFRVFKEGKALVVKDKRFLKNIMLDTIYKYMDFRQLINKHIKRTLG